VLLYGTRTSIHILSLHFVDSELRRGKKNVPKISVAAAAKIECEPQVKLSRGGLVLVALLSGGDYTLHSYAELDDIDERRTKGVKGIGIKTAIALAHAGFGDSLLPIVSLPTIATLESRLEAWRQDFVRELRTNSRGFLDSKMCKVADELPDKFIRAEDVRLYLRPATSLTVPGWSQRPPKPARHAVRIPSVGHICASKLAWGLRTDLFKQFARDVGPAIVSAQFIENFEKVSLSKDLSPTLPHCDVTIVMHQSTDGSEYGVYEVRCAFAMAMKQLVASFSNGKQGRKRGPKGLKKAAEAEGSRATTMKLRVPAMLVHLSHPDLVAAFHKKKKNCANPFEGMEEPAVSMVPFQIAADIKNVFASPSPPPPTIMSNGMAPAQGPGAHLETIDLTADASPSTSSRALKRKHTPSKCRVIDLTGDSEDFPSSPGPSTKPKKAKTSRKTKSSLLDKIDMIRMPSDDEHDKN